MTRDIDRLDRWSTTLRTVWYVILITGVVISVLVMAVHLRLDERIDQRAEAAVESQVEVLRQEMAHQGDLLCELRADVKALREDVAVLKARAEK